MSGKPGPYHRDTKASKAAQELYDLYVDSNEVFEEVYRYRGKVEGVFSAVKRVCGHYLWARGSRWPYGPPTKAQYERARTAFENEILAKFVILSLRRLVTLERLHDEVVNFADETSPSSRYRLNGRAWRLTWTTSRSPLKAPARRTNRWTSSQNLDPGSG